MRPTIALAATFVIPVLLSLGCSGDEIITPSSSGSLEVVTSTSGDSPDPDGYLVQLDEGEPAPIGPSATTTLSGLAPGDYSIRLAGLATNCTVAEGTSRTVNVAAGETAKIRFEVTCSFTGVTVWRSIPLPPSVKAVGLWGTSASDLFVIEDRFQFPVTTGSAIWHYDGSAWTEQVSRVDTSLGGIWGFASSDVYAVGQGSWPYYAPVMLHYDGIRWSEMPPPVSGSSFLRGIWGVGPRNLFVGGSNSAEGRGSEFLARFDGSGWSISGLPDFGVHGSFSEVAGTSGSDVWAIGARESYPNSDWDDGMIVHYDGTGLTHQYGKRHDRYAGIWAIAPDDVWVVGTHADPLGDYYAIVLHYDGSAWSRSELPSSGLRDVWGSSSNDVYAVEPSALLHFDGTSWSKISDQGGDRVWGTSRNDVFILRANEILHGRP